MRISFSKNESELLNRIRRGDDKAMKTIYSTYRKEFMNWSMTTYHISTEDSLDHYQDTLTIFFEKVINRSLTTLDSSIKTYLFGVAKNRIKQQFQKQKRRDAHMEELREHYQFLAEDDNLGVIAEQAQKVASDALVQIGESCKAILKLFYFERKSMKEIAHIMGHKSEAVTRTTKKRCLEKIRQRLKNIDYNG